MVRLRLTRMGASNNPFYRIVAVDARVKRDGKYLECIGYYNPMPTEADIKVDSERAMYWLNVGAQPTDTVRSILRKAGVLQTLHEEKKKQAAAKKAEA